MPHPTYNGKQYPRGSGHRYPRSQYPSASGLRTNGHEIVRGHASVILHNETAMARALEVVASVQIDGDGHHVPINDRGRNKGKPRERDRAKHFVVCLDYIKVDLQSVAFLVGNPRYIHPEDVNAWSICGKEECINPDHLVPGRLSVWSNRRDRNSPLNTGGPTYD